MKKKMMKFISMLALTSVLTMMTATAFAGGLMDQIFGVGSEISPVISGGNEITEMVSDILGFLQYAGFAIAIGMTLYAGIKYMMSAANEKADLKASSIRLVIGALIVAGVSGVFPVFWEVMQNISQ